MATLAGALFASALPAAEPARLPAKPNVLFIAVDDLNHWVGYLGRNAQTKTPNLDRLARRGVWFTRGYCAAPVCNPSRAALLSGLRPGASAVYDNQDDFTRFIPEEITLTTQFRKAGYYVCGAGKIYHGSVHRPGEWDDYHSRVNRQSEDKPNTVKAGKLDITPLNCRDEDMADYQFVSYGIAQLNRQRDQPLFVAVGLTKPHLPWSVPKKYYERFPLETLELPPYQEDDLNDLPPIGLRMARGPAGDHEVILREGTNSWKKAIQAYLAAINFCDAMVGRLLDAFDQSPYATNTLICFWSDHGWHLGEKHHWRKFALWEETTRAPLIWVVPGLTQPNRRCDRTVDFMSIYPTLADLCGLPLPRHVQGESLRALLANPQMPWTQPAVTTYRYLNHAVRNEDWRYIRYANGDEELYNHSVDPLEWTNLANKPEHADQKAALAKWLPKVNKEPTGGKAADRKNKPRKAQKKARQY